MPNPPKSYLLRLVILLTTINLARMAPRQVIPLDLKELLGNFNFPEPQEKDQEIPEPRGLYVNLDVGQDGQQDDLQQVLLVTSGLNPTQIVQRQGDDQNLRNQGRHFFKNGATVFVFSGMNSGGITNNNTNNINTNATATPAAASTTATRNTEFIRAPIGYPAGLPMQYFRKRQDDALSPAVSYPDLFGWNEAAFYGGDLGGGYAGLGGLNGGYSPLAGVPLVPITIGNEVRYIPMNLRMYRQLARSPAPPPPPPAIREQDDQLEEDDMSAFGLAPQLDVMELEDVEQADEAAQGQGQGHSVAGSPGYGILGQRLRPRPLVRRRPLQSLAQNIRRVQYLKR